MERFYCLVFVVKSVVKAAIVKGAGAESGLRSLSGRWRDSFYIDEG
jgi:hypothetical protein